MGLGGVVRGFCIVFIMNAVYFYITGGIGQHSIKQDSC